MTRSLVTEAIWSRRGVRQRRTWLVLARDLCEQFTFVLEQNEVAIGAGADSGSHPVTTPIAVPATFHERT
jgi:hypothetical protein